MGIGPGAFDQGRCLMVRGDSVNARRQLTAAVDAFDAVSMGVYAASARRHLGKLLGGDEGPP